MNGLLPLRDDDPISQTIAWRSNLGTPVMVAVGEVMVAVSGFAVGGDAMASAKVDSNVLIGLQGCKAQ